MPVLDTAGNGVVSHAGAVLLTDTARKLGLDRELSAAFVLWRRPMAVHDLGKSWWTWPSHWRLVEIVWPTWPSPEPNRPVFGHVASDPTVSRLITTLAGDASRALAAINTARAAVRARAWKTAGAEARDHGRDADDPVIIDLDATLVTAHSDKELAAPNFKRGLGFHPLVAFVDHQAGGTGEPLTMVLRPGNAGSNTAEDHLTVIREALRQLPFTAKGGRIGRKVLIRTDSAGATHDVLDWLTAQHLSYYLGFTLTDDIVARIALIPEHVWTPAYDGDAEPRDGAWIVDAARVLDLSGWPAGMRVIVRAERPHPGAQLRFTDVRGNRLTAFATNTTRGQLAHLELRHRRRAHCEDRIRVSKDTGLHNLPLHGYDQNRIWRCPGLPDSGWWSLRRVVVARGVFHIRPG